MTDFTTPKSEHGSGDIWRVIGETQKEVSSLATEVSAIKAGQEALSQGQGQLLAEVRSLARSKPIRWEAIFLALSAAAYIGWSWIGPIKQDAEKLAFEVRSLEKSHYEHRISDAYEHGKIDAKQEDMARRVNLIDLEGSRKCAGAAPVKVGGGK